MKQPAILDQTPLRLSQLSVLEKLSSDYGNLEEDYILSRITASNAYIEHPVARRFDGLTMFICVKGTVKGTINLDTVTAGPNSVVFVFPDTVFRMLEWEGEEQEAYLLFMSDRFIHDINIDLNAISTVNANILTSRNAVLQLDSGKVDLLIRYFRLLHLNALEHNNYSRHIARALVSAAAYQIMAFGEEAADNEAVGYPHSRRAIYVRNFLRLVRDHHRSQRAIGFYADKMFISPKYLSLIIKEATGKSAAEWIDQYVLQEAKNLLRYSGKNVQQIAYELNFTNQSSFGKYFKHLTGMSPTRFQNS